jgi:hypothetical protein
LGQEVEPLTEGQRVRFEERPSVKVSGKLEAFDVVVL